MKKLILLSSLVFVIVIAFVVHAKMTTHKPGGGYYDVEVYIEKGWNLILLPVLSGDEGSLSKIKEDSEIKIEDIKASYFYFPVINSYAEYYPDRTEFDKSYQKLYDRKPEATKGLGISSAWVYSDKSGYIKYSRIDVPEYYQPPLFSGWNFFTTTPKIKGKQIRDFKGTCEITKMAIWQHQKWKVLTPETLAQSNHPDAPETWEELLIADSDSDIGRGILIKVSADCTFGDSEGIAPPPAIPE